MKEILSLGAGVQSTCVLLMSCKGLLPRLDAAVFADTQWEPKAVYKHLAWLEAEAAGYGIPVHKVTAGDLRADAIHFRKTGGKASGDPGYKRWASMPLYVRSPSGKIGLINRQCTKEYKIEPVEKFIRREILGLRKRQVAPKNSVRHWFGISADETYRTRKAPGVWQTFYYPLIMDLDSPKKDRLFGRGYDRQDCLDWLKGQGYPEPPRSACVGCPFHSDLEWIRLRDTDPEGWADAVAFDIEMRDADKSLQAEEGRLVGLPFLHRSGIPLGEVVLQGKPGLPHVEGVAANECLGMCGN